MPDRLLTPEEVSERLAISVKTTREWLRQGKIPGIKLGTQWRTSEQELDKFIADLHKDG